MNRAVVIGGGIGGLSAAIGLRRIGWEVLVYERAPSFTAVGAGITVWPNAVRALGELGVYAPSAAGRTVGVRDHRGRWLIRDTGFPVLGLHRAELLDLLRDALPADVLRPGVEITDVGDVDADLVVAADGVHSRTRAALWPECPGPVYAGSTAFRAVVDEPGDGELSGFLGPGVEIGMVPLRDGRLYWYAALAGPRGARPDAKAFLRKRFRGWPEPVPGLIERTPADRFLQHDLLDLRRPGSFVRGRVALLGDAAHAMPPFLGQGGCQAIEDAAVLAAALADTGDVPRALASYDRQRGPRTRAIARRSRQTGRLGVGLRNPLAVGLRDAMIRALPDRLAVRGTTSVTDWTPPRVSRRRSPA
ncbi:MAG TPA: FAD-dependent monooxygenase [Amycolatopsis sp.]|nr:FAD-dependent monooxygenase [Amycolatopsis sp.]